MRGKDIADVLGISPRKLDRVKKRFVEEGLEAALGRRPSRRRYERKADGEFEARLVALSCSEPPKGWTHGNESESVGQEFGRQIVKINRTKKADLLP